MPSLLEFTMSTPLVLEAREVSQNVSSTAFEPLYVQRSPWREGWAIQIRSKCLFAAAETASSGCVRAGCYAFSIQTRTDQGPLVRIKT